MFYIFNIDNANVFDKEDKTREILVVIPKMVHISCFTYCVYVYMMSNCPIELKFMLRKIKEHMKKGFRNIFLSIYRNVVPQI